MTKINRAVEIAINRVATAQQNVKAMALINSRISRSRYAGMHLPRIKEAQNAYWAVLHEELSDAWEQLAYLAPVNKNAMNLLIERSRSLFTQEDVAIMHFLGYEGSYYIDDKNKFQRELLEAFGVREEETESSENKHYAFAVGIEGNVRDLSNALSTQEDVSEKLHELYEEYGKDSLYFRATVSPDGDLYIEDVALCKLDSNCEEEEEEEEEEDSE